MWFEVENYLFIKEECDSGDVSKLWGRKAPDLSSSGETREVSVREREGERGGRERGTAEMQVKCKGARWGDSRVTDSPVSTRRRRAIEKSRAGWMWNSCGVAGVAGSDAYWSLLVLGCYLSAAWSREVGCEPWLSGGWSTDRHCACAKRCASGYAPPSVDHTTHRKAVDNCHE